MYNLLTAPPIAGLLPARTFAMPNSVYDSEFFETCARVADGAVDMILCDLPYGVLEIGWDFVISPEAMWTEFKRIIKPTGVIVLTAKQPFSSMLVISARDIYRYSWYWEKSQGANVAQTNYRPLSVIEEILVFSKAPAVYSCVPTINYYPQKERLEKPYRRENKPDHVKIMNNHAGSPMRNPERGIGIKQYNEATPRNLIHFPPDTSRGIHPTQKPVALFAYLIRTYTRPGELVFDPCCGSGTTALAARSEGRQFIVADNGTDERTGKRWAEITRERLAEPYTLNMFADIQPVTNSKVQQLSLMGEAQ